MPNNKGYISIVVIVLLLMFAILVYPYKSPKPGTTCEIGNKPGKETIVELPPIKQREYEGTNRDEFARNGGGGPDLSVPKIEYQLIRTNVAIRKVSNDELLFGGTGKHLISAGKSEDGKFSIWYPDVYGEFDFYRDFETWYDNKGKNGGLNQFRFRQEGVVFFVHLGPDGNPVELDNGYLADIYQDLSLIQNPESDYQTEEIFRCSTDIKSGSSSVMIPTQKVSTDKKQLQLEWFLFVKGGYLEAHCKPAIYLYPKSPMLINVKVKPNGYLSYVDPPYDSKSGWTVWAEPTGRLQVTGYRLQNYNYLYYESKIHDSAIKKPQKGWVVQYDQLVALYKEILPKLGLNEVQTKDFIDYWTKNLPKANYYFVGVIEDVDSIEELEITPKPDSINRIRIYFEALNEPKSVEAPDISNLKFDIGNSQLHVTEWGGMVKRDPNHPFTCSQ